MAIVGVTLKQPDETFPIAVDFAAVLDTAETISSATVTARVRSDDTDVTATLLTGSPSISGSVVTQQIDASGTSGVKYIIQYHITTSNANEYEDEVVLAVKEF